MKSHIRKVHVSKSLREKPYICDHCDKGFENKCELTKHMKARHEESVFDCENCGKTFKTKTAVRIHIELVHEVSQKLFNVIIVIVNLHMKEL